jgi:DNA-binding transcriptional regulator YiaG
MEREEGLTMADQSAKMSKATVHKEAVKSRLVRPAPRAAGPVTKLRLKLGLNRRIFSRLTGYSESAIAKWESGSQPDEPGLRRIRETQRFQERLAEVVSPEAIPQWLDTPNDAFDGLKPLEVIERGEIDRLWNMIFYLESGVAS